MEQKQIVKIRKITSPLRKEKLEEGQKILETMKDKSPLEQIKDLFFERTTVESGFSIRELALLFFPKQSRIDPQTGHPIPTEKGINQIYALLNAFRKSIFNRSMILFTYANLIEIDDNRELLESIVYRKMSFREFEDTRKKLKRIVAGLEETIEHALEILAQTPEEIKKRDEEFARALAKISSHYNSKRRKQLSEEDNNNREQ